MIVISFPLSDRLELSKLAAQKSGNRVKKLLSPKLFYSHGVMSTFMMSKSRPGLFSIVNQTSKNLPETPCTTITLEESKNIKTKQ